jgi:hypothetical protein
MELGHQIKRAMMMMTMTLIKARAEGRAGEVVVYRTHQIVLVPVACKSHSQDRAEEVDVQFCHKMKDQIPIAQTVLVIAAMTLRRVLEYHCLNWVHMCKRENAENTQNVRKR